MRKPMVTIMLTTSCIIPVHDRVWSMNLGNPIDNAPCRLDRVDLIMLAGGPPEKLYASHLRPKPA